LKDITSSGGSSACAEHPAQQAAAAVLAASGLYWQPWLQVQLCWQASHSPGCINMFMFMLSFYEVLVAKQALPLARPPPAMLPAEEISLRRPTPLI